LRTAFRWDADQGDLDDAATIATYGGFLAYLAENYEPIAWAEELIEPARAVDHPRLAFLYVIPSQCWVVGRIGRAARCTPSITDFRTYLVRSASAEFESRARWRSLRVSQG
jgi:hypothetical protein